MMGNVAKPKDAGWRRQRPLGVNSAVERQRVAPKATVEPSHYSASCQDRTFSSEVSAASSRPARDRVAAHGRIRHCCLFGSGYERYCP
jgi:hypothetical protein